MKNRAIVLLSGGQDSTTVLFKAIEEDNVDCAALCINYGQRHKREIISAQQAAEIAKVSLEILELPEGILRSTSPLINHEVEVGEYESVETLPGGVEDTFVPLRNLLFLTLAANRAVAQDCNHIYSGVSAVDFGGYPDCRINFIRMALGAIQEAIGRQDLYLRVPLITFDKRETVL
ncbi:MAG: 7-cyano-7-deazaguanine synthase QueC, partial [bacterium]|nr:7-cyano-7-deazaguanine synthase QueC [bacterium]